METEISTLLNSSRTCFKINASSKKKILELIANRVEREFPHIQNHEVYDGLIEREKLGSTGIGHGVALPHCRLKNIDQALAVLMLLKEPIDYDSFDQKPVDIVLALIVPEESADQHLQLLSLLAEKFSEPEFRNNLRNTEDKTELMKKFIS